MSTRIHINEYLAREVEVTRHPKVDVVTLRVVEAGAGGHTCDTELGMSEARWQEAVNALAELGIVAAPVEVTA